MHLKYNSQIMRYFGRDKEIKILKETEEISRQSGQMTVMLGRRRIGKTYLLRKLFSDSGLYLLAKTESESTLCATYQEQIASTLGIEIHGQLTSMREVFEVLFKYACSHHITLVIDEFQEFFYVREGIFADLQELWDKYRQDARINFIVCGSIYTLMNRLFFASDQSLYNRADRKIVLKPFSVGELKRILASYRPEYQSEDLFCLYLLTGGVAKYVSYLIDSKAYTKESMLAVALGEGSILLNEGNELIVSEFRKDSKVFYSVLRLIAEGKVYSSQMDSILNTTVSPYLAALEKSYSLVEKHRPIFASETGKLVKYEIKDNFLNFWFRFIYPNMFLVEMGRNDLLIEIVREKYSQYSGLILERYFRQWISEEGRYTKVGNYWDRTGNNEIDVIAVSDLDGNAIVAEVKINPDKISLPVLKTKTVKISKNLKHYSVKYLGLSLDDLSKSFAECFG